MPVPAITAHQRFQDIDQVEVLSRGSGRDLKLTQLSLAQFNCEYVMADFGEARFSFSRSNCPVRCVGSKANGYIDFSFVMDRHLPNLVAHGYRLSPHTLAGMDPHLETQIVIPPQQTFFFSQVKRSLVEDCLEILDRTDIHNTYWRENFVYAPEILPSVRAYLNDLLVVIQKDPGFLRQPQCKRLVLEDLIPLLINTLPAKQELNQGIDLIARSQLAYQAEEYIQTHLQQPLTILELCKALHTSKRRLFASFEDVFGLSPMAYVKAQRLRAVRQALKEAEPDTTSVSFLAQQFGFWSAGHFARDYKTMFGERPSETLKMAQA